MKTKHKHWAVLTASTLGLTGLASAANIGSEKYAYDGSDNIVEKSIDGRVTKMSYDSSNKVTSIDFAAKSNEHISYDAAGRPISYKDAFGQARRQLSYGYADKVLNANSASGNAEFFYNAEGQLVGKLVAGKLTPYTWDGIVMAAEAGEAFTNEAHVTGGLPVVAGDRDIIVSDYLGNTLSQGNSQFTSTAYGEGLEAGRFTSKVYVPELNGYTFPARVYSPLTARWVTKDPSGFPDGNNNYQYVCANPVNSIDAMGLTCRWVFNGECSNLTNTCGSGFDIEIDADGYRTTIFDSSGGVVKTQDGYSEAWADSNKTNAIAYVAAHGGSYTHIEGATRMTAFTLSPGDAAISALDVEDADDVISSAADVSRIGCRAPMLALPYRIEWSNALIFEH